MITQIARVGRTIPTHCFKFQNESSETVIRFLGCYLLQDGKVVHRFPEPVEETKHIFDSIHIFTKNRHFDILIEDAEITSLAANH